MIADWMGASRAYQGSYDMTDWLMRSVPTITLHSRTAHYVKSVLVSRGYGEVMSKVDFIVLA
jgi:hypothetical protein